MGSTSARLAGEAPPFRIEISNGRVFKARMIDEEVLSEVERKIYVRELDSLEPLKGRISEEKWDARIEAVRQKYMDGDFHFMSPEAIKFFKSLAGKRFLFELIFQEKIEALMPLLKEKPETVNQVIEMIAAESIGTVQKPSSVLPKEGQPPPKSDLVAN